MRTLFLSLVIIASVSLLAQEEGESAVEVQSTTVKVKGKVVDHIDGQALTTIMAVDRNSGSGTFGDAEGHFVLTMTKGDTLLVGAIGYETISFGIPEDYEGATLEQTFYLEKLLVTLPSIDVIPERDLAEIQEDIEELGYDERDYRLSGINAISSPITFLYQTFSKREASIRKKAELENEDRRRDLLKELFQKYVDYDIINLEDDEFDDFVAYCDVSDYFLKNSTQYDFLVFVKRRFKEYQASPAWIRHKSIDDEYYKE